MFKQKKMVVVGGAGFIGSHLVDELIKGGHEVHVIDNLVSGKRESVNNKANFYQKDICNISDISSIIKGKDIVFHLGALPSIQFSIDNPLIAHEVNVTGTLNVLVSARDGGVKKVVYSSSSAVYGNQVKLPHGESMPATPVTPYGLQKYMSEEYLRIFSRYYGLRTVSLRYFNVYGPRMSNDNAYTAVMGSFLARLRQGLPLQITGNGEQTRDFTHVIDVVRANILSAESAKVGGGEVINIGTGKPVSINSLADLFGGKKEYIPSRNEARYSMADNSLAKELIDWEPRVTPEEGVGDLLQELRI